MFNFIKRRAFKKEFRKAVADGVLSEEESKALTQHDVDQEYADKVRLDHYMKETADLRRTIEKERRMTADQETELHTIAKKLNITPQFDRSYAMFRELWAAVNGEQVFLAPVDADVLLKDEEECVFAEPAQWGQIKTIMTRAGSAGFSTSIRLMKGVSYRIGNYRPHYTESEGLKQQATGTLYITNKRLIFHGDKRSTSITVNRIIDVQPFNNAISVSKSTGPNDFFLMSELAAEYAVLVLEKILNADL
jgi:hypothetical protein